MSTARKTELLQEHGLLTLSEEAWNEAKRRAEVIIPLAAQAHVTRSEAEEAAKHLGVSIRQIYKLVRRFKNGAGLLTDLVPRVSTGGKGKARIDSNVEGIVSAAIKEFYLSRQKPSVANLMLEIKMRCRRAGHTAPARNTVVKRILLVGQLQIVQKREGFEATRRLRAVSGKTPPPDAALDLVQIDHTEMDVIVVEESSRAPIGRPFLTLAIDVYTRCIVGLLLTLEPPSATSVGLCLTHIVSEKSRWLENLGLSDVCWPMHGKPKRIHVDNAPEFHSEGLKRGCEQHGIARDYRPKKQPHFGGIIERVIGTAMELAHQLPGTTFSNVKQRGTYNPEKTATLALCELEKWLVLAIATYHETVHGTLLEPPGSVWKRTTQSEALFRVRDQKAFLIDFLPVITRAIGRTGFVVDHVTYYADLLKPWIANREQLSKFIIRRDPRDLSRIWVLDNSSQNYIEIPYRALSNPAITLWEHRKAIETLRAKGRMQVDEEAIFRMIDQMRKIVEVSGKESKRIKREKARRQHLELNKSSSPSPAFTPKGAEQPCRVLFDDIEEW